MYKKFVFAMLGVLIAASPRAMADTFVWKDEANDYTISFPDTWRVQTDDAGYTRLRIAGPLAEDKPVCRMQVRPDGRVTLYPKRLMGTAVMQKFDRAFWEKEVSQFADARINNYYAPASLGGKGDATAVQVAFTEGRGDARMPMQGIMLASIYGGNRYTFTCSARQEVWNRWASLFLSIADSVEFEQKYHPFPSGYYRNFLLDPQLVFPRSKPGTTNRYAPMTWADRYVYNK
jgi:hypothetical protein